MSSNLIALVTIIYGCVAVALLLEGKSGMALCFGGYMLANVGIIWSLHQ